MRCYAPFCKNSPDNVPASQKEKRISFHGFPTEKHLRAAWLRALGKQHSSLPDSAMVCSEHFLDDDIYETESGSRQIDASAVPSTVQVCMICLDTDSKLLHMRKHKLEKAYEYLSGYAPCNQGNLKQTLCVQCAQRLKNFSRFRDQSLRARALMMDLVEKHELITRRHIKTINRAKHGLKNPMVVTTLGADFCDLHIQADTSEDRQTESETTIDRGVVKTEESDDSMAIREDMDVVYEDGDDADNDNNDFSVMHEENISDDSLMLDTKLLDNDLLKAFEKEPADEDLIADIHPVLKFESADFKCSLCSEEFVQELAYEEHMNMHAQSETAVGASESGGAGPSLPSLVEIKPEPASPRRVYVARTTGIKSKMGKARQSREERLEKKRIAERSRKTRLKNNPEEYEKLKKEDRERYRKRKAEKNILPIAQLSSQKRKIIRERNRIYSLRRRERKKNTTRITENEELIDIVNDSTGAEVQDPLVESSSPGQIQLRSSSSRPIEDPESPSVHVSRSQQRVSRRRTERTSTYNQSIFKGHVPV